ncbi:ABC transporter ATP-binding protein [Petralouisia muris]|uniref:ABC transporter ATP-binding protein n=1 Tax=Petralouisia muris TaxID=3032872 RepID=A0AC61S0H3_9FIRM|nr:ABC transporter ATP-binding protein [Petralouisia muris]TGY97847.1 ABC transporter ATP-binding protein [Petralouisia muris]
MNKRKDSYYLGKLLALLKPYKLYLAAILLCLIASSGIVFLQPLLISRLTDQGLLEMNLSATVKMTLLIFLLVVAGELISLLQSWMFVRIHNAFYFSLISRGFQKLMRLKISYFTEKSSAEIIDNMRVDTSNAALITDRFFGFAIEYLFRIASSLVGLFVISWRLTLIVMLIVPVKCAIVSLFSKKTRKWTQERLEKLSDFTGWFSENVGGIKEIKLWGLYQKRWEEFQRRQQELLNLHQKEALLESVNNSIEAALSWGVTGLLYILGGMQIIEGRLSLGGVFAFISYSGYVTNPIMALLNLRIFFSTIIPSAKRLFQIFELEEEPDAGKLKMDQAPYLFSKTVRENIDLDSRTDQEAFLKACEKSGADKFIAKLPKKEDSVIGQNGSMLSGGERKKIAVARAMAKEAPIIVLDEATAGYDGESDAQLHDFLIHQTEGKTLIVITHNREHLEGMDRVYCLENGKCLVMSG